MTRRTIIALSWLYTVSVLAPPVVLADDVPTSTSPSSPSSSSSSASTSTPVSNQTSSTGFAGISAPANPQAASPAKTTQNAARPSAPNPTADAATAPSRMAPVDHKEYSNLIDAGVVQNVDPSQSWSLNACFERSDDSCKDIVVARRNVAIAAAAITTAGAIPNPQFQLQTGFGQTFAYLYTGQTQQVLFSEDIQTAGKRTKKLDVAKANLALAELQLDATRFDVHNRTRRAYSELAAAEAYESLIEAERAVGLRLADVARKRVDAGKTAQSEFLQADLNVAQYDTQRNQAQGRLQQATAALTQLLGEMPKMIDVLDVDDNGLFKLSAEHSELVPSPDRNVPSIPKLLASAFDSRLDLRAAQQQVWVNYRALTLAKAKRIPDVVFAAGYAFTTFAAHQPAGLNNSPAQPGVFITANCETPVLYQYQGEIQQAAATMRQSEKSVALLKSQIATDVVTAYNEVKVARQNLSEFQQGLLPLASKVAHQARRGYEVGKTDLARAIVAQQQYQQTLSSYFDAVVAYQNAWADMEKAVGIRLKL